MKEDFFVNKKFNFEKIKKFGFKKNKNEYIYSADILNGEFVLNIKINIKGELCSKLYEKESGELYTLHLTDAEGNFVGEIRKEYFKILENISENCCENAIFKSEYTYKVINYLKEKYGDEPEYLWEKFPDNAVARRKDNSKWYLAILTVRRDKLGFETTEKAEVLDIRALPEEVPNLIKQDNIFSGYHMNKKTWISIILDGSMSFNNICKFIDNSYELAGLK